MHSIFSRSISFDQFREIAQYLAEKENADVLLGSPLFPDSCLSYVGLGLLDELILPADISARDLPSSIRDFAFADDNSTIGYISYECGMTLRGVSGCKSIEYPALHLKKYTALLVHDAKSGLLRSIHGDEDFILEMLSLAEQANFISESEWPHFRPESVEMSLSKNEYENGVVKTLEYIKDGLTYQLNLSTKFSISSVDINPVRWFFALNKKYPAPYYALFHSGEKVIVSTSPELFLKVEEGRVLSEPIKGTAKLDGDNKELEQQLKSSAKEDAELSMIVDLVRNDISADCKYGSVVVEKHKSVFAVDNLLQMYSRVRGELAEEKDCIDLFLNAFPGGSITGCPKKSSMELIDCLEPHTRGPYCGSIFLIKGRRDLVSSIAIRTAVYDKARSELSYWAGSGIVIDSDPQAEFLETMAKAGKIIDPEGM